MTARTRTWAIAATLGVTVCSWVASALAQQNGAGVEVLQLRPNFYMIASAVSNVGVQVGPDGVVVVNTGTRALAGEVLTAIQTLTRVPIRYVINTNGDADLVGGNGVLAKAGLRLGLSVRARRVSGPGDGAAIIAHENLLTRMRAASEATPPFPPEDWPNETFHDRRMSFYLNGEGIEVLHLPAAHSDADSVVFFRRSDVVVAGHILDATRFPVIDLARGGSIQGEIDALNRLIELAIPAGPYLGAPEGAIVSGASVLPAGTEVLPGRGRVYRQIDVVDYRDVVVIIRDTIRHMIGQNMTLEQILAAAPAKAWEPRFGATSGAWTTNDFVEAVYKSLMNERQQAPAGR